MDRYDALIIGSGHNALITAAYLARAGWGVLVLEQNDRPGGLVRTEELTLPGFHHDVFSSAHPIFTSGPAYAELGPELEARGLRYLNTDIPTGISMADGRTSVLSRAMADNLAEAERLSPGDGAALGQMLEEFTPYTPDVFQLFGMDLSSEPAREIIARLMRVADGSSATPFMSWIFGSAEAALARLGSPVTRAMLGSWVMHAGRRPDEAGSAIWMPLFFLTMMGAGMAIPEGGAERLAVALSRLVTDHGGKIRTGVRADRIVVRDGKAVAVRTADGEEIGVGRAVVACVNPDQLYLKLLADAPVSGPVREQAARYRYNRGCVQIQLALSEPPRWPDPRLSRAGQPHLTSGLEGCALALAQGVAGLLPADPTFSVDCPTNLDPSRAPAGKAILRVQLLGVPCRPRGDAAGEIDVGDGRWGEDLKRRFADRALSILGRHIPNVPSSVLGMHVLSPDDLAAFSPNQGPGDPYAGASDLAQSYLLRPLPGRPGHRSAVPNVYQLGAATWPGAGVGGSSGYIVAKQLLG